MKTPDSGIAVTDPASHGAGDWPALNWPLLICGYFAVQVVWRRLLGGGLALDEAEILLWSRNLAWGYGPQPPLYSWLQWGFLQIVPDPLLALALLKNMLLAATYLAVWRLLRAAYPDRIAGPAALALFLVPQISWDSQRDLTHSVLATTLAAGAALAFWTRTLPGRPGGWILLGGLTGLGLLAKPNFLIVPLALVLAAASAAETRGRLAITGLLLAAVTAAAVVAMPLHWALTHPDLAFASVRKLQIDGGVGLVAAAEGLLRFARALLKILILPALVLGAIRWRNRRIAVPASWTPLDRLLLPAIVIGAAIAAAGVLAGGVTQVRPVWLLPVVCLAAPLAAARLLVVAGPASARALLRTLAVLAVVVFVALAIRIRYGEPGNPALNRAPVAEVADMLAARFPDADRIVAAPAWLAGSLVYVRPELPVVSAETPGAAAPPGARVVAIWWDGDHSEHIVTALSRSWGSPVALAEPVRLTLPFPLQPDEPFDVDAAEVLR